MSKKTETPANEPMEEALVPEIPIEQAPEVDIAKEAAYAATPSPKIEKRDVEDLIVIPQGESMEDTRKISAFVVQKLISHNKTFVVSNEVKAHAHLKMLRSLEDALRYFTTN